MVLVVPVMDQVSRNAKGSVDGSVGCVGGKYVCWWNTQNLFLEAFHSISMRGLRPII